MAMAMMFNFVGNSINGSWLKYCDPHMLKKWRISSRDRIVYGYKLLRGGRRASDASALSMSALVPRKWTDNALAKAKPDASYRDKVIRGSLSYRDRGGRWVCCICKPSLAVDLRIRPIGKMSRGAALSTSIINNIVVLKTAHSDNGQPSLAYAHTESRAPVAPLQHFASPSCC
jgi:hypothetical protein